MERGRISMTCPIFRVPETLIYVKILQRATNLMEKGDREKGGPTGLSWTGDVISHKDLDVIPLPPFCFFL